MKKILLFLAFIMSGLMVQAQSTQLEKAQAKEMDKLKKIVTYEHKNLTFNKNQIAKLERLFFKKSKEIMDLRNNKSLSKSEYSVRHIRVEEKYEPLVEDILSPAQKIEYRKHSKKQIPLLKG